MEKPDGGMFGIKLVLEAHLRSDLAPCLNHDYDCDDDKRSLMNFGPNHAAVAANIPVGNRSLVYVTGVQKFVWAIEYTGTVDDGKRVAMVHRVYDPGNGKFWRIFRPIRHLARADLVTAPTLAEIERRTGVRFTPNSFTMKYISAEDYRKIYEAVPWQWTAGDGPWTGPARLPLAVPVTVGAATLGNGTKIQPKPTEFVLPPIHNAESLLARIRQVRGMPERNMEDVVKAFLIALGHREQAISFQIGHVDVRVDDERGNGRIVVEVKRSLLIEKARQDALRKGFDYSSRHGAPMVVITDADIYEVYDRNRGIDYDKMCCGRFQLTRFANEDRLVMDLLRPPVTQA
jgi:hypothetical protein